MAAASSVPCYNVFSINARGSYLKGSGNMRRGLQVIKVQNFQDQEGRSTNMVDANLSVLKERIEMVKVKERLERCCKCQHGWNYYYYDPVSVSASNHKVKFQRSQKALNSLFELAGLVFGTVGFTCFGGTLFLCLVSLLVHLQS